MSNGLWNKSRVPDKGLEDYAREIDPLAWSPPDSPAKLDRRHVAREDAEHRRKGLRQTTREVPVMGRVFSVLNGSIQVMLKFRDGSVTERRKMVTVEPERIPHRVRRVGGLVWGHLDASGECHGISERHDRFSDDVEL